jgi:hypothetical protein
VDRDLRFGLIVLLVVFVASVLMAYVPAILNVLATVAAP